MSEEKKFKVLSFFKAAWNIDGEAELVSAAEAKELLKSTKMSVIRLNDSKRGTFYIATFHTQSHEVQAEEPSF